MTQQHDMGNGTAANPEDKGSPAMISRRALLRGATATVPTILTLHSGAAFARSSNLIGAAPGAGPEGNEYRCLDLESVYATDRPNVYDMGDPAMGHVTTISSDVRYYRIKQDGWSLKLGEQVNGPTMCSEGGQFFRKSGWSSGKVGVKPGVLVSSTALSSFSGAIRYTDV